jgi:hypothetical protein
VLIAVLGGSEKTVPRKKGFLFFFFLYIFAK